MPRSTGRPATRTSRSAAAPVRQPVLPPASGHAAAAPVAAARETAVAALALCLAIWVAHYWHFRQFGLYEDDWFFVGFPMLWNWHTAAQTIWTYLVQWPQGRPVSHACSALLAFLGTHLAGVAGAYVFAFLVNAASAVLFYAIVRRFLPAPAAFCGALSLNLAPSMTATAFLTNAFMPEVGLLFSLAALWCYLNRRLAACYAFAVLTLLSYESCFLPLFAAPLLVSPVRRLWRGFLRHGAILGGMAAAALAIRHYIGESKVVTLAGTLGDSLQRVVHALYLGPRTTLLAYWQRPVTVWHERSLGLGLAIAACALLVAAALLWLDARAARPIPRSEGWRSDPLVRVAVCGLAIFIGGYALAITPPYYPPVIIDGRITGMHLAASVGCGLLASAAFAFLRRRLRGRVAGAALVSAAALYLAVLAGFQFRVQQDLVAAWGFERQFWRQVVRLCPDVSDGTLIVHETDFLPLAYVGAYSWADSILLDKLFTFPAQWHQAPRIFSLPRQWEDEVEVHGDQFTWSVPQGLWVAHREILPKGNLILLRAKLGMVDPIRAAGVLTLRGRAFPLKAPGPPLLPALPRSPLYSLLLGP